MANPPVSPEEGDTKFRSAAAKTARPKSGARSKRPVTSPFFGGPTASDAGRSPRKSAGGEGDHSGGTASRQQERKPRPLRGTVSCLPIPPLSADRFGLIQEELAHKPFHLLIAITFLIRTKGVAAIPVFRKFVERFPTPETIVDANPAEITEMIRHLGLSSVRCRALRRYARLWLERPPSKDVRYGVKNYPNPGDGQRIHSGQVFGPEDTTERLGERLAAAVGPDVDRDANLLGLGSAWEIGHVMEGPYAIDSWRIFCRDELLGRATDWLGGGREPEFQPEWMRVLPRDKELRAYCRWLWGREGWEWDPVTGARTVLSDKLRTAFEEGNVAYDDQGGLIIVNDEITDSASESPACCPTASDRSLEVSPGSKE